MEHEHRLVFDLGVSPLRLWSCGFRPLQIELAGDGFAQRCHVERGHPLTFTEVKRPIFRRSSTRWSEPQVKQNTLDARIATPRSIDSDLREVPALRRAVRFRQAPLEFCRESFTCRVVRRYLENTAFCDRLEKPGAGTKQSPRQLCEPRRTPPADRPPEIRAPLSIRVGAGPTSPPGRTVICFSPSPQARTIAHVAGAVQIPLDHLALYRFDTERRFAGSNENFPDGQASSAMLARSASMRSPEPWTKAKRQRRLLLSHQRLKSGAPPQPRLSTGRPLGMSRQSQGSQQPGRCHLRSQHAPIP